MMFGNKDQYVMPRGVPVSFPGARPGEGTHRGAPGAWAFTRGVWPEDETWVGSPMGPPPAGGLKGVRSHRSDFRTNLLQRGWTLYFAGVILGERLTAGMGLLIAPWPSACVLEFTPVAHWVVSLHFRVSERVLTVV